MTNSNKENGSKERETLKIRVDQPESFGNVLETEYITSRKLADKVNALFVGVFADYYGCVIQPNNDFPGMIDVKLYFRPSEGLQAGDKYIAFQKCGAVNRSSSIIERLNGIDSRFRSSEAFEITQDACELLHQFYANNGKLKMEPADYKRNKLVTEVTEVQNYNRFILDVVVGIDINKLVSILYGRKNSAGESVDYMVSPVRPIGNVALANSTSSMNWILSIARVSKPQIDKISAELGLLTSGGTIPVVTAANVY